MLKDIANAILFKLTKDKLIESAIDFDAIVDMQVGSAEKPKINIAIKTGEFKKITLNTYKVNLIVDLYLLVQELRGEEFRNYAMYDLLLAIVNVLLLEKLGLKLQDPLKPVGFSEIPDKRYSAAGYTLFLLKFTCSFNFTKSIENDLGMLESIINKYYLVPDDGIFDAEGQVNLLDVFGGDAYSEFLNIEIFGGYAGSKFEGAEIYGGKAGSTY